MEEKTQKVMGAITDDFQIQHNPNSCDPTCVANVLHQMADSLQDDHLRIPLHKVNKICGYKNPRGVIPEKLVPNLRRALRPLGYNPVERFGATRTMLNRVIMEKGCSFPIVGLSHEYMREERDYRGDNDADHSVILLKCGEQVSIVYDPFESISPSMERREQGLGRGVVALFTYKFLEYWKLASVASNWMLWIERQTVKNETLDAALNGGSGGPR